MKYFFALVLIPLLLGGCQTMNDYVFLGAQQSQDKSSTYKLNSSIDVDKSIEKTPNALTVKKQIVGEYQVDKQWTTYLRWKIDKINIRINNECSIVADLYAPEKKQPFYGIQANNCLSKTYIPEFEQKSPFKYENMTKHEKRIIDFHGLGQDAIKCGWISHNYNVIEVLKVQKGYEQTVYETGKVGTWLNVSKFIAPKDGYFIWLKDQHFTNPAIAEYVGIIAFTEKLE